MVLKKTDHALSSGVRLGITPLIKRLEEACLACIEHSTLRKKIEHQKNRAKEYIEEKNRLAATLSSMTHAVVSTNGKGLIEYLNPAAEHLLRTPFHSARGLPLFEVLTFASTTVDDKNPEKDFNTNLPQGGHWVSTEPLTLTHHQGDTFRVEVNAAPISHKDGIHEGHVILIQNITQKRHIEQQISWQLRHDSLTGLPNRMAFEKQLKELFSCTATMHSPHALLYIDLDQFKVINDTCGHLAGDGLLQQLALRMKEHIREADTLARIGGDEFAVILKHCPLNEARQIAEQIRKTVQGLRYTWDDKIFTVGVSIGLAPISPDSLDAQEVFTQADLACYAAKDHGRNQVYLYEEKEGEFAAKQRVEMEWVSRINSALEHEHLILYCQGIYPLSQSYPTHIEVLLRMVEGDNIIPPGAFLPAAERYGKIHALDLWVVKTVINKVANNPLFTAKNADYRININLAGPTLSNAESLAAIKQLMLDNPHVAQNLCLEITETSAITNIQKCLEFMEELIKLCCQFSLDDFGSGLSSFSYLKNLPVSQIKIDGEFVKDIVVDKINRAMVTSIHQIAQAMSIQSVAEFVEDDATLEILREIGIDFGQGYGIEMPLSFDEKLQQLEEASCQKISCIGV